MKKSIDDIKKIFSGARKIKAIGTFSLLVFVIQFLWYIFEPSHLIPIWILSLAMIAIWLVWLVTYAIASNGRVSIYKLPQIRTIHKDSKSSKITFIMDKSELYSHDMLVSIFYLDKKEAYEIFLGIGHIEIINSRGYAQVVLIIKAEDNVDSVDEIINSIGNNFETKQRIQIKPSIPKAYLRS